MRARWTGPTRYFPDLGLTLTAGDEADMPARDVKEGEYWEPASKAAAKPKTAKKATAKTKTEEVNDADN